MQFDVRGNAIARTTLRQHDDLLHASGERANLRDGGREDRIADVDALRDEDEPSQKKSVSPSVKRHASGARFKVPASSKPMKLSERVVGTKPRRA